MKRRTTSKDLALLTLLSLAPLMGTGCEGAKALDPLGLFGGKEKTPEATPPPDIWPTSLGEHNRAEEEKEKAAQAIRLAAARRQAAAAKQRQFFADADRREAAREVESRVACQGLEVAERRLALAKQTWSHIENQQAKAEVEKWRMMCSGF